MNYWNLLLLAAAAINAAVQCRHFVHMLQLNSYRPERYRAWCVKNDTQLVNARTLLPTVLVAALFLPQTAAYLVSTAVLLTTAWLNRPKPAKKPLVYTARVKRLLLTFGVLTAAVFVGLYFLNMKQTISFSGVYSILIWLWVGVANRINLPLEKAIANGYVRDAKRRLQAMPDLTVIGITGSYGKTSTKTFLHALLSARYNVLMTPESFNTTMGVVRTVREQLRPSHQIFLAEMGAKNPGDIREICELVSPRYGVLTSIGEQHLETFKTVSNIVNTKFELADALPPDGQLFANGDNLYIRDRLAEQPPRCAVTTYGLSNGEVTATVNRIDLSGCTFTVTVGGQSQEFTTRVLGAHNIQNLAGCIAVAYHLGIPLTDLVYPVKMLKPVEHRLQLLPNGYIDDAYNSNPAGFRSALEVLRQFDAMRILVTPGMVELGDRQEALNRELGAYAAKCCDMAVLVGEKQAPPLQEGLLSAGFPAERIAVVATLQEALTKLGELPPSKHRIVLLENDLPDNF